MTPPERGDGGLPPGWSIELDPAVRRTDDGRVLIGGSPFRFLRLTPAGAAWLDGVVTAGRLPASSGSRRLARRLVEGGLAHPVPAPDHGLSPADVAVVIPVRDAADGLRRTLATMGQVGEVVVVDDGSIDAAEVVRVAAGARVLRNDRALGPGAARQRGWRATTRPLVAFLDDGVEAAEGWLAPLLAHLGDPSVAAVAPRVASSPGRAGRTLAAYEAVRSSLDLGAAAAAVRPGSRVPYVPTAALLVRREALESVGGFDPRLRVGEDVDLVWRLGAQGWSVRYEPAVVVHHPSRPNLRSWLRQRVTYGISTAALARRHGPAVAPLAISGWSALAWFLALLGRPGLGAAVGAGTTAALVPKVRSIDHPVREATRVAGLGNLRAGNYVAGALRRPWWPIALLLGIRCRRARPALMAAVVLPPLLEWSRDRVPLDPLRFGVLRLLDDVAYGSGVWVGCLRERSAAALLPSFSGPLPALVPADHDDAAQIAPPRVRSAGRLRRR